ncbi:hypothetical protein P7K49_008867 [Saguinus oedipus]|uniref:Uncharacterized protein n=1 Tax=Saguinus oedipus TaxID=9490 RepID=A0ABQ9VYZ5_SAGOE|nr:hypothetical protein P7K49_008867 [Saguinus oedipus]
MDAEYPAFEPPLCSELKHLCRRLQEAYRELKEDLTPFKDDRYYRWARRGRRAAGGVFRASVPNETPAAPRAWPGPAFGRLRPPSAEPTEGAGVGARGEEGPGRGRGAGMPAAARSFWGPGQPPDPGKEPISVPKKPEPTLPPLGKGAAGSGSSPRPASFSPPPPRTPRHPRSGLTQPRLGRRPPELRRRVEGLGCSSENPRPLGFAERLRG